MFRVVQIIHAMLWISGRPIGKCDPLLGRGIQHDPEVAQGATQLSIIRNTCKFCVNNFKTNFL